MLSCPPESPGTFWLALHSPSACIQAYNDTALSTYKQPKFPRGFEPFHS